MAKTPRFRLNLAGRPLVVVGGASLDTLHFSGQTVHSAGGAGLYSALAAQRAGAPVTMVGPRPSPAPRELSFALEILDWRGQEVPPEQLPSFEIEHYGGGLSEMISHEWRAEGDLSPENIPPDLPKGLVYCCPLCDPFLQLEFIRHFHRLGQPTACGTFEEAVTNHLDIARQTLELADIFFCNRSEAVALFGSLDRAQARPDKLLFITQSAEGALVVQGDHISEVPGTEVDELDPTGAGDTFCGTVLANLLQGEHPVCAARYAAETAAQMVTRIGPEYLYEPVDASSTPDRAVAKASVPRIEAVGKILEDLPEANAFDFTGDDYPPMGHQSALDYFFASTLQQFGFWTTKDGHYDQPMYAPIGGRELKGSDFIWAAYRRWLDQDPDGLSAHAHAKLNQAWFDYRLRDDSKRNPLPAPDLHLEQALSYGHDLTALGLTPKLIVEHANKAEQPLRAFLEHLDQIGGYKEDPLRKKSALLAAILYARPERFLHWGEDEEIPPIIDYHLQRSCLRIGLIEVAPGGLRRKLESRQAVSETDEQSIRQAAFEALTMMHAQTGKPMAALDWFFFQNRHRCPEMNDPVCSECPIDSACAHHKELFQPVIRSTFY